ncbi:MAG: hypothetical protein WAQ22_01065 [Candidatus Saccharimonas sp.]
MTNEPSSTDSAPNAQPTPPRTVTPPPAYASAQPAAPVIDDRTPRSYLAIITLALFAGQLGLARWYRGDTSGKTRFWIAIACIGLSIIPFINILAAFGLFILSCWGIVDFFVLYKTTTDTNNTPYIASQRDLVWAKNIRTYYIVVLSIAVGILVLSLIAAIILTATGTGGSYTQSIRSYY